MKPTSAEIAKPTKMRPTPKNIRDITLKNFSCDDWWKRKWPKYGKTCITRLMTIETMCLHDKTIERKKSHLVYDQEDKHFFYKNIDVMF